MTSLQLLEKIAHHVSPRPTYPLIITGKGARIHTIFNPPIVLDGDYEMGLDSLYTYYAFPNLDEQVNGIKFLIKNVWHEVNVPTGSYELSGLAAELKRQITSLGGNESDFNLTANRNTLKSLLTIKNDLQVDFKVARERSIKDVLGFPPKKYAAGVWTGAKIIQILNVNAILVYCDAITGTRLNGIDEPIIFTTFPSIPPGYKLIEKANPIIYLPLTTRIISSLTVWLTGQDKKLLDLRGEELTVTFHIRAC